MANNNQNSGSGGLIAVVILIIVFLLYALGACSGSGSSSYSSEPSKCQVCGKTFTNSDDRKSIAYTNMCEKCYSNYKYSQDMQEGLKKYQENYGD